MLSLLDTYDSERRPVAREITQQSLQNMNRVDCAGLRDVGGFVQAYGIRDDGAALVRPDGHVAWRSAAGPASDEEIVGAVRQILGRSAMAQR